MILNQILLKTEDVFLLKELVLSLNNYKSKIFLFIKILIISLQKGLADFDEVLNITFLFKNNFIEEYMRSG